MLDGFGITKYEIKENASLLCGVYKVRGIKRRPHWNKKETSLGITLSITKPESSI